MPVLLIGTLDTKGTEIAFVRDRLRAAGVETLVMDASVLTMSFGTPKGSARIAAEPIVVPAEPPRPSTPSTLPAA